jgi:hypothetical protein
MINVLVPSTWNTLFTRVFGKKNWALLREGFAGPHHRPLARDLPACPILTKTRVDHVNQYSIKGLEKLVFVGSSC